MPNTYSTGIILEAGYLFIDGGCMRSMLKDVADRYFEGNPIEFNYRSFTSHFAKVFYYDCLPPQDKGESKDDYEERIQADKDFFDNLGGMDKFHVNLGSMHRRKKRNEQKQVDIMIAVDILAHAFNKNTDHTTLFTTDSDFIPVMDKMVDNGMNINLWYADTKNCNANRELIASADRKRRFTFEDVYSHCTENFCSKFKLPEGQLATDDQCGNEIQQWQDPKRGIIKLGKDDDKYILAFKGGNSLARIVWPNLPILRAYAEDKFGIIIPEG